MKGSTVPRRISELEGLRAFLAWWVVAAHIAESSGFGPMWLGRGFRVLLRPDYAVGVFIILSGFVIDKLCRDSPKSYGVFITRRFFRLWPAYVICLFVAIALRPAATFINSHPPIGDLSWDLTNRLLGEENMMRINSHFFSNLLAHLTMLHSAIPRHVLPLSAVAFLFPAWSISLEWQFYLVAPLLFRVLRWGGVLAWIAFWLVAGTAWIFRDVHPLNLWMMEAFLPQSLFLFGVGIVSHRLWRFAFARRRLVFVLTLSCLAIPVWFIARSVPIALWCLVLAVTLSKGGIAKKILNSFPAQFLGRLSYSTYLCHVLVIWGVQAFLYRLNPAVNAHQTLLGLSVIAVPLIVIFSYSLYRAVEAPAIELGKSITSGDSNCLRRFSFLQRLRS